jgi:nitrilase
MPTPTGPVRVAAAQATPVYLDREATVEKACALIEAAGRNGAQLVVLPESFIPGYPHWVWRIPPGDSALNDMYARLVANAVEVPGPATRRLCEAARQAGVYLVTGMSERNVEASGTSLYNALLFVDPHGEIMGVRRKLVPTGAERLVWAQGDGSTLRVFDTALGTLAGLICWENYMPLARYAVYAWGAQLYVAATWDRGEPWLSTLRHIAAEGRVYVIGCCTALRTADIPDELPCKRFYADAPEWINVGDSAIVDPEGRILAGPVQMREEIIYAEVDPAMLRGSRWMLDVAGHYARPDVFQLGVNTAPRPLVRVIPEPPGGHAGPA